MLPKPGAWMETFKQIMGFVLLATVVYLLAFLIAVICRSDHGAVVRPLVYVLVDWSHRTTANFVDTLRTWSQGAVVVCVIWIVMFPGLNERVLGQFHFPGVAQMMAERFAPLQTAAAKGPASGVVGPKTVLVDFTASLVSNLPPL